jgi:cytochrome c oxidase cbb3-type subunit 4
LAFIGGWMWVWSARRKPEFDAAARLPLEDSDREQRP